MKLSKIAGLCLALALVLCLGTAAFAQGRGKGNGGGKGRGNGSSAKSSGGLWSGEFPDYDSGKEKERGGKNDKYGKNKDKYKDKDKDKDKNKNKDTKVNRFRGLAKKLGTTPEALQARYESERYLNPRLTHGQFVAAHMVARNHRGVSANDILRGLRRGDSIGQTLHNRGWDSGRIDRERRRISDVLGVGEYRDIAEDWITRF